ncbi:hypothetical protein GCM10010518_17590 [Kitasatospora cinereorecta]
MGVVQRVKVHGAVVEGIETGQAHGAPPVRARQVAHPVPAARDPAPPARTVLPGTPPTGRTEGR